MEVHLERLQVIAGVTTRGVENVFLLAICYSQAMLQLARQSGLHRRDGGSITGKGGGGGHGVGCSRDRDRGLEVLPNMDNQPIFGMANADITYRGHHQAKTWITGRYGARTVSLAACRCWRFVHTIFTKKPL
jgi:hypothetical protein